MFNVDRSMPAPASLAIEEAKSNGEYNCPDVLEKLDEDFFKKCYLCEEKYISKIEIDHLQPKSKYPSRKFDWENLFYCCGHCNGTKSDLDAQLLDCTDASHKVYDWVTYNIVSYAPKIDIEIKASVSGQVEVDNTVLLLNEIYSGKSPGKISSRVLEAGNIRHKIYNEVSEFEQVLIAYLSSSGNILKIQEMLSRKSPFSAFKRQIVKSSLDPKIKDLSKYFD